MDKLNDEIQKRKNEISTLIEAFITSNLSSTDRNYFSNITDSIFDSYSSKLMKGKPSSWACGIVHNLCVKNNINIKIGDIYSFFNVCNTTGLKKSKEIEKFINLNVNRKCQDEDFKICIDEKYILAQKIMKKAYSEKSYKKKKEYAKEAIEICENCSDAYIVLAKDDKIDSNMQEVLLRKAVTASLRMLGIDNILDIKKDNFSNIEFSAYFASQYMLANHLWRTVKREEAIEICMDIIDKDSDDKLMIRDFLLSWTIIEEKDKYTKYILDKYRSDYLTSNFYSKALYEIKIGNIIDGKIGLRKAIKYNRHVVNYILKKSHLPKKLPVINKFRTKEEAIHYAVYGYDAWKSVPNAINILKEINNEFIL